ncbi:hypothetical protein MTQ17_09795 [Corynebacterium bovis]|uniref:hypothetical protein n=1 Tax=Corynebacterium bovis TaxID=36808 RepID=UPI0031389A73
MANFGHGFCLAACSCGVRNWIVAGGKPPVAPWMNLPHEATGFLDLVVNWAMYLGVLVAVCGTVILLAMMSIDRNRGEAGIASSDQARWVKWAIGVALIATAPKVVTWIVAAFPR